MGGIKLLMCCIEGGETDLNNRVLTIKKNKRGGERDYLQQQKFKGGRF